MYAYPAQSSVSFIFDNPCHIAAAFCADATQHQHAGLDLAGQIADGRSFSALNAPDIVQNFELNIAGYGLPNFLPLGVNEPFTGGFFFFALFTYFFCFSFTVNPIFFFGLLSTANN